MVVEKKRRSDWLQPQPLPAWRQEALPIMVSVWSLPHVLMANSKKSHPEGLGGRAGCEQEEEGEKEPSTGGSQLLSVSVKDDIITLFP